ncbi:MAG: oxalate:formate antiporter [Candidatus Rokuibacteriota bacterium]|nr:MAG: oxalate:formate antiporter [Candidatus Rokubacteria bacterium]
MDEYVLDEGHWPEMPAMHRAFLERAILQFRADERLVGIAAGGSFISRMLDEHSDLDLVVVSLPAVSKHVLREGPDLAQRLGPLLASFPGDHVGEPRLLICLYGPPLLHVDLKFMSTEELAHRVEDPQILWDRRGAVRSAMAVARAVYPQPRLQWIEDRFWVWVHYIAVKIDRGELFEAIDGLGFVRARVLGPLVLAEAGEQPNGVRRVEQSAPRRAAPLRSTLASHDRQSCWDALTAAAALYTDLREQLAVSTLVRRTETERAVRTFLEGRIGRRS